MEFSKKFQVVKLIGVCIVTIFCGLSWLIYKELPPMEWLVSIYGILGFGDVPYMWKTGKENPIKIQTAADIAISEQQNDFLKIEIEKLKTELSTLQLGDI